MKNHHKTASAVIAGFLMGGAAMGIPYISTSGELAAQRQRNRQLEEELTALGAQHTVPIPDITPTQSANYTPEPSTHSIIPSDIEVASATRALAEIVRQRPTRAYTSATASMGPQEQGSGPLDTFYVDLDGGSSFITLKDIDADGTIGPLDTLDINLGADAFHDLGANGFCDPSRALPQAWTQERVFLYTHDGRPLPRMARYGNWTPQEREQVQSKYLETVKSLITRLGTQ